MKSSFIFHIGDTLQLQHVDSPDRERKNVRLIGCMEGKSLIVTAPSHEGKLILVREDQHFVVRMFSENTVQAFNASVLRACQLPYPYFHLTFPMECESQVIRRAHRVDLNMIISICNTTPGSEAGKTPARLTNLSTAGAEVVCKEEVGEEGDLVDLSMKLTVGEIEKYLNLSAEIKRIKTSSDSSIDASKEITHGVHFHPMSDEETIVLHGFVYEAMIKKQ